MRSIEGWLLGLVASVPEIKPLYDATLEVDAELFLEQLSGWASQRGYVEPVAQLLRILERDYERRGDKIRGIIEGSFVERLVNDPLAHHFGPHLRRAMRPRALGHGDRE
ncbi:MAG: hypothetical protein KF761_09170 [Salinibacterium sp.]|nr:hypothetical protein [Salinibacterium sp.]